MQTPSSAVMLSTALSAQDGVGAAPQPVRELDAFSTPPVALDSTGAAAPYPTFWGAAEIGLKQDTILGRMYKDATRPTFVRDFTFSSEKWLTDRKALEPNAFQMLGKADETRIIAHAKSAAEAESMRKEAAAAAMDNLVADQRWFAKAVGGTVDIDTAAAVVMPFLRPLSSAVKGLGVAEVAASRALVAGARNPTAAALERIALGAALGGTTVGGYMAVSDGKFDPSLVFLGAIIGGGSAVDAALALRRSLRANETFAGVSFDTIPALRPLSTSAAEYRQVTGGDILLDTVAGEVGDVAAGARQLMQNGLRDESVLRRTINSGLVSSDTARVQKVLRVADAAGFEEVISALERSPKRVLVRPTTAALAPETITTFEKLANRMTRYLPENTKVLLSFSDDVATGMTIPLDTGRYLVNVRPTAAANPLKGYSTLFHEFGHILINNAYKNLPDVLKARLMTEYGKARKLANTPGSAAKAGITFRDTTDSLVQLGVEADARGSTLASAIDAGQAGRSEYFMGAGEYMAEQFVKEMQHVLLGEEAQGPLKAYIQQVVRKIVSLSKDVQPHAKVNPVASEVFEFAKKNNIPYSKEAYEAGLADTAASLAENSLVLRSGIKAIKYSEPFLGKGWASLYDKMRGFGAEAGAMARKLVVDPTGDYAQSAAHDVRRVRLELGKRAAEVEVAIEKAVGFNFVEQITKRKEFRQEWARVSREVTLELHSRHEKHLLGEAIEAHPDEKIEAVLQAYEKSGFAETALHEWQAAGMRGADAVDPSPWYFPVQHSGAIMHEAIQTGRFTRETIERVYADQFQAMFPTMSAAEAEAAGKRMVENVTAPLYTGAKPGIFIGVTRDEVETVLQQVGVPEEQLAEFLKYYENQTGAAGVAKNMRRRMKWDMTRTITDENGVEVGARDFLNTDTLQVLEGYTRHMSGRSALARQGYDSLSAIDSAITVAAKDSKDPAAVREVFENVVDSLLGRHVGEKLPDTVRSLGTFSALISLRNSGLYNILDAATTMHYHGVARTVRALIAQGASLYGKKLSAAEATRLVDVLKGGLVSEGRFRPVLHVLQDGYQVPGAGVHELIQSQSQFGRFATGMEHIRRFMIGVNANLVADALFSAAKGTANPRLAKVLRNHGVDDALLHDVKLAFEKFGDDTTKWSPDVLSRTTNALMNLVDNTVQANRLGEIPAWMEFSSTARVMLPYLNFMAGAHNKLLRRGFRQEGTVGVLMMALPQLVLGSAVVSASNVAAGREWNDRLVARTVETMPLSGWGGLLMDYANNGMKTSVAPYAALTRAHAAALSVASGEVSLEKLAALTPMNAIPVVKGLTAWADDEFWGATERGRKIAKEKAREARRKKAREAIDE